MENSNQSAFPVADTVAQEQRFLPLTLGLTKREYFAGLAMQGLLHKYNENGMYGNHSNYPMVHEQAVQCADLILAELAKEK